MLRVAPYSIKPEIFLDEEKLNRLSNISKTTKALAGEVVARPYKDHYEVLLGAEYLEAYKRSYRSGELLVSLCNYTDEEAVNLAISIAEKMHKIPIIDLITPYQLAIEQFKWRKSDLAKALGLKKSTISNRLKLSKLDEEVVRALKDSILSLEHAKILSRVPKREQRSLARQVSKRNLTTRDLLKRVNPDWVPSTGQLIEKENIKEQDEYHQLEREIGEHLGCPTNINLNKKKGYSGTVELHFFSLREAAGIITNIFKAVGAKKILKGSIRVKIENMQDFNDLHMKLVPSDEDLD
jgi:hypothetical protein